MHISQAHSSGRPDLSSTESAGISRWLLRDLLRKSVKSLTGGCSTIALAISGVARISSRQTLRIWERLCWLRDMIMEEGGSRSISKSSKQSPHFGGRALQYYHNSRYRNTNIVTVDTSQSAVFRVHVSVLQNINPHRMGRPESWNTAVTGMEFFFLDGRPSVKVRYSTPGALVTTKDSPQTFCSSLCPVP